MALKSKKTVSIGVAARQTNASIKQIRHWEELGFIEPPDRVICGERSYRQFTAQDLETIRHIKELLDEGYTLKAAARKAAGNKNGRK